MKLHNIPNSLGEVLRTLLTNRRIWELIFRILTIASRIPPECPLVWLTKSFYCLNYKAKFTLDSYKLFVFRFAVDVAKVKFICLQPINAVPLGRLPLWGPMLQKWNFHAVGYCPVLGKLFGTFDVQDYLSLYCLHFHCVDLPIALHFNVL